MKSIFAKKKYLLLFILISISCNNSKNTNTRENVFYLDENKVIHRASLINEKIETVEIGSNLNLTKAKTNLSVITNNNSTFIYFTDTNNNITEIKYDEKGESVKNLTELYQLGKTPFGIDAMSYEGEKIITFRSPENDLILGKWTHGLEDFEKINLTKLTNAQKAFENPKLLETNNGYKVFFLDSNKNVIVLGYSQGKWNLENWTKKAESITGEGPLGVMLVNNQEHVFFRRPDNEVGHIIYEKGHFRKDCWTTKANRWTQRANAPKVSSGISAKYVNGQENIFYLDKNNNIQNLLYDNGKFKCYNWTEQGNLPLGFLEPVPIK